MLQKSKSVKMLIIETMDRGSTQTPPQTHKINKGGKIGGREKQRKRKKEKQREKRRRGKKVTPLTLLEISQELGEEGQEVLGTS